MAASGSDRTSPLEEALPLLGWRAVSFAALAGGSAGPISSPSTMGMFLFELPLKDSSHTKKLPAAASADCGFCREPDFGWTVLDALAPPDVAILPSGQVVSPHDLIKARQMQDGNVHVAMRALHLSQNGP